MDRKKLIGKKIKEIRDKNKITQEYFSELINLDPSSLSNIENGKGYPSMQTLLNIIDKFHIKPQEIFDFEYLQEENDIENEMIEIIKQQPYDKKQILYKIIKQFV